MRAKFAAAKSFDAVGTARVSSALYDRTCRISMDYQSAGAEVPADLGQRVRELGFAGADPVDELRALAKRFRIVHREEQLAAIIDTMRGSGAAAS